MTGDVSKTLMFHRDELTFPSFHVTWKHTLTSHQYNGVCEDRLGTGFSLTWFIQHGDTPPNIVDNQITNWKPVSASPMYREPLLVEMVSLVKHTRDTLGTIDEAFNNIMKKISHKPTVINKVKKSRAITMTLKS